ncbi:tagaturonate reductase [Mucilaginibacter yixingensis]|uniref:Tagaturonate reductase n=1 Tax=Mucilaginibacter yixingensis TaxID=1295612 RepID=A0A2T5JAC6_9SPHI|nr:tagaturonate reductase [Mucilaginibacter yixingensis]PTQ96994.1 tagaturonate reductase [Mucilaginibacter yixingensis]
MILSKNNLNKINSPGTVVPDEQLLTLPEKVLQFGTGVLLRGLPDYYIDKANRQGVFNGRVVVVKSTDTGSADDFDTQDGLYTLYIKGIEDGQAVDEQIVCSSISRVVSAAKNWQSILDLAKSEDLKVVISNTTEVGIQLVEEDINQQPPASFPGKLLAVLYTRYKAFNGNADSGLVIVPTELIVDNGKKLKQICVDLANFNQLEPEFIEWLTNANSFCSSLVDRIVPGKPSADQYQAMETECGYKDGLRIISEPYSLWAIEGDEKVASVLSFGQADKGVVVTPDIEKFRELKLRLLNATHTLSCGVAFLSGFKTVKLAMDSDAFTSFITQIMRGEIAPAIPYGVTTAETDEFTYKVLDRFRNPNIEHMWISISAQYSSKIKMRVLPLLLNHYKQADSVPQLIAFGFAAFIRFMKVTKTEDGKFVGNVDGVEYVVTDSQAEYFYNAWTKGDTRQVVETVLQDKALWDADLTALNGFADAVTAQLDAIEKGGALNVLENLESKSLVK